MNEDTEAGTRCPVVLIAVAPDNKCKHLRDHRANNNTGDNIRAAQPVSAYGAPGLADTIRS